MKSSLLLLIASFLTLTTFAQKSKSAHISPTTAVAQAQYTCPMHPDVVTNHPGTCPKCKSELVVDRRGSKQASTVFTCSMHPDVKSDKPGKCPVCHMDLKPTKANPISKKA